MADDPIHVHGDSVRLGIRLAMIRFTNRTPPEDQVRQIEGTRPAHVILTEFPLVAITNLVRDRQHRRREVAMHSMQIMLSRMSEFATMSQESLEMIATKAWQMAAAMETQESVSASLDSMDPAKR